MARLSIIVIFILFGFASCGQTTNKNISIVYKIDLDYMEGCETGKGECKPIVLKRHFLQDSIKIIFPGGGTQSDVYLYSDTAFVRWVQNIQSKQPKAIRHDQKFVGQGNPTLDLTGLQDGIYRSQMTSCGLGGTFKLTITTEN